MRGGGRAVLRAAGRGESLTGWLKGLGSEGRMCRWVIMACSRSLSLASCGEAGGEQGPVLGAAGPSSPSTSQTSIPSTSHPCPLVSPSVSCSVKPSALIRTVSPAWSPAQPLPVSAHFSPTAHAFSPHQGQRLWLKFSGTCVRVPSHTEWGYRNGRMIHSPLFINSTDLSQPPSHAKVLCWVLEGSG